MADEGKTESYELGKDIYDILHPWAIVPRVFVRGTENYDVTVIASRSKESFHDPQVCFKAQNWTLSNQRIDKIQTKTRGDISVTLVDMENAGDKRLALYFFKTTQGYFGDIHDVKLKMMMYKFKNLGKDDEGAFIRVIPGKEVDEAKLKKFTAYWLDNATKTSNGYY